MVMRRHRHHKGTGESAFVWDEWVRARRGIGLPAALLLAAVLFTFGSAVTALADDISARAAVVMEGETGNILYAKNPNLKLPPASTTKLVTAMVVLDRLDPDQVVTVSASAANTPSVAPHLKVKERYTVRDLLSLALIRSLNSAAVALAEAVAGTEEDFVPLMNARVARLGAANSRFINASGLPEADQYVTAYELAKIMRESLEYPLIVEIISTKTAEIRSQDGRRLALKNTNHLLWNDDHLVVGKTGYTKAARHCLVSAAENGQGTLITAVLGESDRDDIWKETVKLIRKGEDVLGNRAYPTIYVSQASFTRSAAVSRTEARPMKANYVSTPKFRKSAVRNVADSYSTEKGDQKQVKNKKNDRAKKTATAKKSKKASKVYAVENRKAPDKS